MKKTYSLGIAVVGLLTSASASAHVEMLMPVPRLPGEEGGSALKEEPCGQETNGRTTKVTTFKPGQTIEIQMKEYIDHPGYYAVGFDPDGDDDLPFPLDPALAMSSKDNPQSLVNGTTILAVRPDPESSDCSAQPNKTCTVSVTLPNMTCENCTLQLIQFMTDASMVANAYYYQCADIKLAGDGTPTGGAGGTGGGGAGGSAGGAGGSASGSGGVSAGSGGTPGTAGSSQAGSPSGTAGATAPGGAGGSVSAGGTGTTSPAAADDGGCSIGKAPSRNAWALATLGLLLALGKRRRR